MTKVISCFFIVVGSIKLTLYRADRIDMEFPLRSVRQSFITVLNLRK